MESSHFLLAIIVTFIVVVLHGQDDIVQPNARGNDVVEAVCNIIEASCVFPDDKLLTRRLAYVESLDGVDAKTFRQEYYGGIWQVDKNMFDVTQGSPAASYLAPTIADVRTKLGIDWPTVTWSDLTKPLHSAVGARLYLQYQSRNELNGIPRATADQAQFWVNYYRPLGDVNYFVKQVNRRNSDCFNAGADIAFVLDASSSIGSANFLKIKKFVKDAISAFDIGFDKTRVGIVQYSTTAFRPFDLGTYGNKTDMLAAVDRLSWTEGSTRTDLAIDRMTNVSFTAANGARPVAKGHPRIAIVLTDGASDNPSLTLAAAKRMHDANIVAFAIGVGTKLNVAELTAIASSPTCTYLILLNSGFAEIDSLISVVEKKACEAPIVLDVGTNVQRINTVLPVGVSQNCQVKVSPGGITVKLSVGSGATEGDRVSFYTSPVTYPNGAFYKQKAEAWLGKQGVIYIEQPEFSNASVYCNYQRSPGTGQPPNTSGPSAINISIGLFAGDQDLCQPLTCSEGATCADFDSYAICLYSDSVTTTLQPHNEDSSSMTTTLQSLCLASLVFDIAFQRIYTVLPVGSCQNCQVRVPPGGLTVKLSVSSPTIIGERISFYTSTVTYPNETFYEQKAEAWLKKQAVIYIEESQFSNASVYCNYLRSSGNGQPRNTSGHSAITISIGLFAGDQDLCRSRPCPENATCADHDSYFTCMGSNLVTTTLQLRYLVAVLVLCLIFGNGGIRI